MWCETTHARDCRFIVRCVAYVRAGPGDAAVAQTAGVCVGCVDLRSDDRREESDARDCRVGVDTVEELAASLFDD